MIRRAVFAAGIAGMSLAVLIPAVHVHGAACGTSGAPISTTSTGTLGNNRSSAPSIDANGQLVAFESDATNFGASNGVRNIWIKYICTGELILATQSTTGAAANAASYAASIDSAGDTVVYDSFATNLTTGATKHEQVFAHNLDTGVTTLVSDTALGTQGNRNSNAPIISPDGGYVVFESEATNFGGSTSGDFNIYVKDLASGALTVVTNASTGNSKFPWISSDGTYVSFYSDADFGWGAGVDQVYQASVSTEQISLVSETAGSPGNGNSTLPSMDATGRYVVFDSIASNLTGARKNQAVLHDEVTGTNTLLSRTNAGVAGNAGSGVAWIDDDGTAVAFVSAATNLVSGTAAHSLYLATLGGGLEAFTTPAPASGPTVDAAADMLAVTVTPGATSGLTRAGPASQIYLEIP
jgi:hypothetical protein